MGIWHIEERKASRPEEHLRVADVCVALRLLCPEASGM